MPSRNAVLAALAILVAMIPAARICHAGSWSPSLRVASGLSTEGDLIPLLGLAGHVVHDHAWIRPGIEGGWWEQLGHSGSPSLAFVGVYPYQERFTSFLMGAIVQNSPARESSPLYVVLGAADMVIVEKSDYYELPTKSEWGHAPTLSAGFGYAATHGFGESIEARWYWRREESDRIGPIKYFTLSAGVRF